MNILAIIPARSGSKGVPGKNIKPIKGKPMIAYSIEQALASKLINRVIVSTDSEEYAEIAKNYGAEIPFIRPAEYATDEALDIEVFRHALEFLKDSEGYEADIVVQLRPTYPIRDVADIDKMIEIAMENEQIDSVRSIAPASELPYKMWVDSEDGNDRILPFIKDFPECYNMSRRQLPKVYVQNACIDVLRPRVIFEKNSMTGDYVVGYKMTTNLDIDTIDEFKRVQRTIEETQ